MNKNFKHNLYVILLEISLAIVGVSIGTLIIGIRKTNVLMIVLSIIVIVLLVLLITFIMLTRPYRPKRPKKRAEKKEEEINK